MTTKYFKYDIINNTIIASAANIKKAGDPATPQYKELCAMKKAQPTFSIAVKEITKNKDKQTYKDLTIAAMRTFITHQQENCAALTEFEALVEIASYPIVKSWFLAKYKGIYKKTATKQAMTKDNIVRLISHKVTPIPASNNKKAVNE